MIDAECAFRLKEGEQVVYNALKPLWERAFDNLEDANVYKPKNGMDIHFIVDEYSRELGMEFNTFFILKRTRTLLESVSVGCLLVKRRKIVVFCGMPIMSKNMGSICTLNLSQSLKRLGLR